MGLFKQRRNFGMLLLGVWLIAQAVIPLVHLSIPYIGPILAVMAIAAGVLILIGR